MHSNFTCYAMCSWDIKKDNCLLGFYSALGMYVRTLSHKSSLPIPDDSLSIERS